MEFLPVEESACYRCRRPRIGELNPSGVSACPAGGPGSPGFRSTCDADPLRRDRIPRATIRRCPLNATASTEAIPGIPERPRSEWPYSERLLRALDVAARMHAGQSRKGTKVPYLSHLLGACAVALAGW
jgi:hypothetical protein